MANTWALHLLKCTQVLGVKPRSFPHQRTFSLTSPSHSSAVKIPLVSTIQAWDSLSDNERSNKVENFYRGKTGDKVQVRYVNREIGKGVFATQDIEPKQTLFQEKPVLLFERANSPQALPKDRTSCTHCGVPTEDLSETLRQNKIRYTIFEFMETDQYKYLEPRLSISNVRCSACNSNYCHATCKEADAAIHMHMCDVYKAVMDGSFGVPENEPNAQVLFPFWNVLAGVRFMGNLLYVIREERDRRSDDLTVIEKVKKYMEPFLMLSAVPLSKQMPTIHSNTGEVRTLTQEEKQKRAELISKYMNRFLDQATKLLKIDEHEAVYLQDVLKEDGFDLLCGMLQLNGCEWDNLRPFELYLQLKRESDDAKRRYTEELIAKSDFGRPQRSKGTRKPRAENRKFDYEIESPKYEAGAILPLYSCLNHSCAPNSMAIVDKVFERDNKTLLIQAGDKPIRKDDEITVSYLPPALLSRNNRRDILRNKYLFDCKCKLCVRDLGGGSTPVYRL